jgi:site-specific recombinase XerC
MLSLRSVRRAATVPILPPLVAELRAHRVRVAGRSLAQVGRDALVFTTLRGKPQGARNALRAVHAAGKASGLNSDGRELVGLHDLRHSFVAIALASGLTLPEASALARHANPRITAMAYAGLNEEFLAPITPSGRAGTRAKRQPTCPRRRAARQQLPMEPCCYRRLRPCSQCPDQRSRRTAPRAT